MDNQVGPFLSFFKTRKSVEHTQKDIRKTTYKKLNTIHKNSSYPSYHSTYIKHMDTQSPIHTHKAKRLDNHSYLQPKTIT